MHANWAPGIVRGAEMPRLLTRTSAWRDRRDRFGALLAATVAAFAIEGIATPQVWDQVVVTALLSGTLLLALWAADAKPIVLQVFTVVALAVLAISIVEAAAGRVDNAATRLANLLLVLLAPPAVVIGVVRSMRARNKVTVEAVFGVLCLYILLGLFFAQLFGAIDGITGTFFANNLHATPSDCVYFSFTTLATIGYGDITTAGNLGHTLAVTEGLVGQIYLVTIVSLLVGNLGRAARRTEP
jgi:D-alanyl-lipoteichoic acid acyltransferase DltB (MBOAT superfamily)